MSRSAATVAQIASTLVLEVVRTHRGVLTGSELSETLTRSVNIAAEIYRKSHDACAAMRLR